MSLHHDEQQRYARHLSLDGFGEAGQAALSRSKILLVGMGGLGCPAALYLASSGVGTLGLADDDRVALSNLGRQILYETADIGRYKVDAAHDRLSELNPEITLQRHRVRLSGEAGEELLEAYDLVIDGSDNVATRFWLNQQAHQRRKPLVTAAIHGWKGQIMAFANHAGGGPCYRCVYPAPPHEAEMPKCSESGVFAPLAGMMGSWQAALALQWVLGTQHAFGHLWQVDLRGGRLHQTAITPDPACAVCG